MNTVHLTDSELLTVRQGMTAFLMNFSHDEPDVRDAILAVLQRLDAAQAEPEEPAAVS
jgi:hypothetical protein